MFMMSLCMILLVCTAAGLVISLQKRTWQRHERILIAVLMPLAAPLAVDCLATLAAQPYYNWNNIRLARSFALFRGISLYPGQYATGPIVGTLHLPVSHLIYWPAHFAKTPLTALLIASSIAFGLVLVAMVWLFFQHPSTEPGNALPSLSALVVCGYLLLGVDARGFNYCAFVVHTDAPALFFITLAGGLLLKPLSASSSMRLLSSAACVILAVGCKQTLVPVALAFLLFLLIVEDLRVATIYLAGLIVGGSLLIAAICHFVSLRDLYFNVVTLASHQPLMSSLWISLLTAFYGTVEQVFSTGILIISFVIWFLSRTHGSNSWRDLFRQHRWLVFALAGLLLAPIGFKARMTTGGYDNHIGLFSYLFAICVALGLGHFMERQETAGKRQIALLLSAMIILLTLPSVLNQTTNALKIRHSGRPDIVVVYRYLSEHPAAVYFPEYPLATYYAEHRFYHFDGAVKDRSLAGYRLSDAQYAAGLPSKVSIIAYHSNWTPSPNLIDFLAQWHPVTDPELAGWRVWLRTTPATLADLSR